MRKILNLIKCEFIKNYTFSKVLFVLIVLLISTIILSETSVYHNDDIVVNISDEIKLHREGYEEVLNYEKVSLEKDFLLNRIQKLQYLYELVKENETEINYSSWQNTLVLYIHRLENKRFVIGQMIEFPNEKFEIPEKNEETVYLNAYDETVLSINTDLSLEKQKEELEKEIARCEELLKENKFYKYIEYRLNRFDELGMDDPDFQHSTIRDKYIISEENKKIYEYIVKEEVESEQDIRVLNLIQISSRVGEEYDIVLEKDFSDSEFFPYYYDNYEGYVRYYEARNKEIKEKREIISYAFYHNIKHDLNQDFPQGMIGAGYYMTTKVAVNKVFHLSVVVLALVILTSAGIVSHEHTIKTEKALLTSPIKRRKVLFSKFIYLIMHTYIIWLVAFILICLYSGIRFGFGDLFTPKLIYQNGNVMEVNYILHTLKMLFINSIPVVAMVTILLTISTITLSTTMTTGIILIITVLSPWFWQFICQMNLKFLVYTPLPYIDLASIQEYNQFYLGTLEIINTSQNLGLLVSIITIIICYGISNFIYVKRDVKN